MIKDGEITYPTFQSPLLTWRPEGHQLYVFLVSVIATALSYQLMSMVTDLAFGFKPYGQARFSDLYMLRLVRQASPAATIAAIFPRTFGNSKIPPGVAKWIQGNRSNMESGESEEKNEGRLGSNDRRMWKWSALPKLLVLLAAAPVFNVVGVILSLEYDRELTFAEAKFGGMALGIDPNLSIPTHRPIEEDAFLFPLVLDRDEFSLVEFYVHRIAEVHTMRRPAKDVLIVFIRKVHGRHAVVEIVSPYGTYMQVRAAAARLTPSKRVSESFPEPPNFGIRSVISNETAAVLLDYAIVQFKEWCGAEFEGSGVHITSGGSEYIINDELFLKRYHEWLIGYDFAAGRLLPCKIDKLSQNHQANLFLIGKGLADKFTFVDATHMDVIHMENALDPEPDFIRADSFLLFRRRRSYVSVPLLLLALSIIVFMRILVAILTRNDLDRGIELFLKFWLSLPLYDTMLACGNRAVDPESNHHENDVIEANSTARHHIPSLPSDV